MMKLTTQAVMSRGRKWRAVEGGERPKSLHCVSEGITIDWNSGERTLKLKGK